MGISRGGAAVAVFTTIQLSLSLTMSALSWQLSFRVLLSYTRLINKVSRDTVSPWVRQKCALLPLYDALSSDPSRSIYKTGGHYRGTLSLLRQDPARKGSLRVYTVCLHAAAAGSLLSPTVHVG
jgi:hypothetical protein